MRVPGYLVLAMLLMAGAFTSAAQAPPAPSRAEIEGWYRDYMGAVNRHDIPRVLSYSAPDRTHYRLGMLTPRSRDDMRNILEWEASMRARYEYEIVGVRGDWITVRSLESNLLYSALEVRRPMVWEHRFRNGVIHESHLKEIRETGRVWRDALAELEQWLAAKPFAETAGVLDQGRLRFTGEGASKLGPLLTEYRKRVATARVENEKIMRSFIAAMNRHDVDAQYTHYGKDMHYLDNGQRIIPNKEEERGDREFESANNAKWSYTVLGAGLDSLEMVVTEGMDFYDLLGVGPRSHRARYRFRDGKIVQAQAWDWTQTGRPYDGARDRFVAWALKERSAAAAQVTGNGRLIFGKQTAARINALVKEWYSAQPCRLYHPSFNFSGTQLVFSSDCEGPWGIYVANADGTLPRRVTPRDMEARLPNWSPDGAKLVFQVNQNGNWDIYTVNVDGSKLTRMTDHPRGDSSGVFSPDSSRILFASDRGGINELFVLPAAGGDPVQITRNKGVWYRSVWAPDGSHILYRASVPPTEDMSQPGEFYRVRLDGTEDGVLAGGKRREANQSYSPDGKLIACDAHEDGVTWESGRQWDIWVMNADGSGRRNLTARNNTNDWGPSWSPDGKTIVFLSGTNNIYDLHLMNPDGTNVRRLTNWTVPPAR